MHRTIVLLAVLFFPACGETSAGSGAGLGLAGSPGMAGATAAGGAVAGTSSGGGFAGSVALGGAGAGGAGQGGIGPTGGLANVAGQGGLPAAGSSGASGAAGRAGTGGGGAPNPSLTRQVLMVGLSTGQPTPGDALMIKRLEGRNFDVTYVADTAVTAGDAGGKDLILISSSEESGNLGTKLRDLATPTLCMEDGSFADMKLASARDHALGTSALDFIGTALAGGLSGNVSIATAPPDPGDMGWGTVGPKALIAATIVGQPTQAALFGYEKGDDMIGMAAPARRVGFAAREAIASHFSEQGLTVFDTAVDWTLGLE